MFRRFGSLFGCCRHIMATRGAEAARGGGSGGGSSSSNSAAGRSRRPSQSGEEEEEAAAATVSAAPPSGSPEVRAARSRARREGAPSPRLPRPHAASAFRRRRPARVLGQAGPLPLPPASLWGAGQVPLCFPPRGWTRTCGCSRGCVSWAGGESLVITFPRGSRGCFPPLVQTPEGRALPRARGGPLAAAARGRGPAKGMRRGTRSGWPRGAPPGGPGFVCLPLPGPAEGPRPSSVGRLRCRCEPCGGGARRAWVALPPSSAVGGAGAATGVFSLPFEISKNGLFSLFPFSTETTLKATVSWCPR